MYCEIVINELQNILVLLVQSQRLAPPIKMIRTHYLLKNGGSAV